MASPAQRCVDTARILTQKNSAISLETKEWLYDHQLREHTHKQHKNLQSWLAADETPTQLLQSHSRHAWQHIKQMTIKNQPIIVVGHGVSMNQITYFAAQDRALPHQHLVVKFHFV